jgi:hypothetical protein
MIRRGAISALVTAATIWIASVLLPWVFVVQIWGRLRRGVA